MDKEKLIQELMATFVVELEEHVIALNRDLLILEKADSEEDEQKVLQVLFRTAHSLKGASRSVSVSLIEKVCHNLEEILVAAREGIKLEPYVSELLFKTADGLQELGIRLKEKQDLAGAPLSKLLEQLITEANHRQALRATRSSTLASTVSHKSIPSSAVVKNEAPEIRPEIHKETPKTAPEAPKPAALLDSIRIAGEKIDGLLSESGELLVLSRRGEKRLEAFDELSQFIKRCSLDNKAVTKFLRKASKTVSSETALFNQIESLLSQQKQRLSGINKYLDKLSTVAVNDQQNLLQSASLVDNKARALRMTPFADACRGLERMVRDLTQNTGKEVLLELKGQDIEIDRNVLEKLKDPLLHLIRNCIDHGIETVAERKAKGKKAQGLIEISVELRGDQIEVIVKDDGQGLNEELILAQAKKKNLVSETSKAEVNDLIFTPGFSTSPIITEVSGRGVGLDIVRNNIILLNGKIDFFSTEGKGTQFRISVPLTLSTVRVLLLKVQGQDFALISSHVKKTMRVSLEELKSVEGKDVLPLMDTMVPVTSLAQVLGLPMHEAEPGKKFPAVVVKIADKKNIFLVDELIAEQEIVIKSMSARVKRLKHFSGATFLQSGDIALVLNAYDLVKTAAEQVPRKLAGQGAAKAIQKVKRRLLIVEDSLTTRSLEKSILESAGYEVAVAADGAKGWQLLQDKGAELVVSDVDMPIMDGFTLADTIRKSSRFKQLPIILVTARATDRDKARGIEVGANAYLVKSDFDQTVLLDTIRQLL